MRVLIAGSHGLIGTALCERLHLEGHEVVRLVRTRPDDGAGTGLVRWDPQRGHLDEDALEGAGPYDGVVNLAGAGIGNRRWSEARRTELSASRIESTRLLAEWAAGAPSAPVMINASAVGYYGDRGDEILTEVSTPGDGFLAELCVEWEAATAAARSAGLRVVLLRSGVVLSPRGGLLGRLLLPFRLGLGARLGGGRQWLTWISLDDEVEVLLRALTDEDLLGPVNASAPEPVTNGEFTSTLARVLHRPAFLVIPVPIVSGALGKEMAAEFVFASQRAQPARLEAAGHHFAHRRLDDALEALLTPPG